MGGVAAGVKTGEADGCAVAGGAVGCVAATGAVGCVAVTRVSAGGDVGLDVGASSVFSVEHPAATIAIIKVTIMNIG